MNTTYTVKRYSDSGETSIHVFPDELSANEHIGKTVNWQWAYGSPSRISGFYNDQPHVDVVAGEWAFAIYFLEISPKHLDALIVLDALNIPVFAFRKNGNYWLMGRNTAYAKVALLGYAYNQHSHMWEKKSWYTK